MGGIASLFVKKDTLQSKSKGTAMNAFQMSKKDYDLVQGLKQKITCNVDKKTEVITISVQDQDPLVSAIMADSVRQHLQNFIIQYRTNKARIDVQHYLKLTKDAKKNMMQVSSNTVAIVMQTKTCNFNHSCQSVMS